MTKKLQSIIEYLKSNQGELYADGAFKCFVDNLIDVDELTEILKVEDITLPKEFYQLSKAKQKRYRRHVDVVVDYTKDKEDVEANVIFNKVYFYDLAERARKTIYLTTKLTRYVYDLIDVNLIFLGMQYIKISNTSLKTNSTIMEYAEKNNITNLYDLTMRVMGSPHMGDQSQTIYNFLMPHLNSDKSVGLDLNNKYVKFYFLTENLFYSLPRKEFNSLKVKFLILSKDHLRGDLDYYDLDKPAKWYIKDYESKGLFNTYKKNRLMEHLKKYPELLEDMKPNGYLSLYYAFIANEEDNHE